MEQIIEEVWRKLDGFDGKYQISNYGRVRTNTGWTDEECRQIAIHEDHHRLKVALYDKRGRSVRIVADLVAKTFIPNPNRYEWVIHLDGNPLNTRVDNLRWVSLDDYRKYKNGTLSVQLKGAENIIEEEEKTRTVWRDFPDGSFKISDRIFQDAANYFHYGVVRAGFFPPEKEVFDDLFL